METWWGFFESSPYINFIHTSGGQARGDTTSIKDNNKATWAGMHKLTKKPIIADSGLLKFLLEIFFLKESLILSYI